MSHHSGLLPPQGGCTEAVVEALAHAKQGVFVQAYSFTSAAIAKALVDAHKRGSTGIPPRMLFRRNSNR